MSTFDPNKPLRDLANAIQSEARQSAAALQQNEWQPIETAPMDDETRFLATNGKVVREVRAGKHAKTGLPACYDPVYMEWTWYNGEDEGNPTHWMLLPAPPA
jgi:hypothetical protein